MGQNNTGQLGPAASAFQATPVRIAQNVATLAAGVSHSFYITADGALPGTIAPMLTLRPLDRTSHAGGQISLAAAATGQPAPTYQWFKNDQVLAQETRQVLHIAHLDISHAGEYRVRATNSAGFTTSDAAFLTVRMSYEGWRKNQFPDAAEQADANISGPFAAGTDGIPHLLRYAFGVTRAQDLPVLRPRTEGTDWIIDYPRPEDRDDIRYQIETSPDLVTWSELTVARHASTDEGVETWRAATPISANRIFFRLRIDVSDTP